MTKTVARLGGAAAVAAVLAMGHAAQAAPPTQPPATDMASIQQQLNALRAEYDAKIADLQARLKAAEDRAAAQPTATAPAAPPASAPADVAPGEVVIAEAAPEPEPKTSSPNAMNPGVSVVLNGNYVADSRNPDETRIAGFPLSDDAKAKPRGFSIDESEITLAANVDPYLSANLTVSFDAENQPSVEEAYIQSSSLPAGFTVRAGRFFSAIGYLNERHAHNWSFIDMPLPYRALLGNQYGDDGLQLRWLAPTPFFLEFGGELYRGDSFPASSANKNKAGAQTAFVHTGADINDNSSWLAALSYIHTDAHDRVTDSGPMGAPDTFNGSDGIGIASLVYKWAPGGNPVQKNLVLSGEYFAGHQDGTFNGLAASRDPRGWYAQAVYQFAPRWSIGARYAALDSVDVPNMLAGTGFDGFGHSPRAASGLIEYDTSEFGRFRAEFTHDMSDQHPNDELMFQYTVVYGPHGAHRY
ncbi:MAG TPA: hypothetical protein VGH86_08760 [Phenylobacterium sp.]|jgi:hypothetical protein